MKHIDIAGISQKPEVRLAFLQDFVGFTDDDAKALHESVDVLGPKLGALLDAIYDQLLSYDDTRRIFLGAKGEVDPRYIAIRKEHLTEWLLTTVGAKDPKAFANYLMSVAAHHTRSAGESNRVVPPRYMVALTTFVSTALWATLFELLPSDPARVRRLGLAWNKMMGIQLEFFLKGIAPHWPNWDETT